MFITAGPGPKSSIFLLRGTCVLGFFDFPETFTLNWVPSGWDFISYSSLSMIVIFLLANLAGVFFFGAVVTFDTLLDLAPPKLFFMVTANFFFETGLAAPEPLAPQPARRTMGLAVTGGVWICSGAGPACFDFSALEEFFLFSVADLVDDLLDTLEDLRSVGDEESPGLSLSSISFTFI